MSKSVSDAWLAAAVAELGRIDHYILWRVNQGETPATIKVRLGRGKLAGGMMAVSG